MPKINEPTHYDIKRVEVFTAGTHTDSSGRTQTWTTEDLDKTIKAYSESPHEAPLVKGHPKHDDPAFGWIKSVYREGKKLFADLTQVPRDFYEQMKSGAYKKRSISFYPDGNIRHLGALGAMPPALKHLENLKFSEFGEFEEFSNFDIEEESSDFMDWETASSFRGIGRVLRGIREAIIDKYSKKEADEIIPDYVVNGLENTESSSDDFSEQTGKEGSMPGDGKGVSAHDFNELAKKVNGLAAENGELKTQVSSFSEQLKEKDEEISALKKQNSDRDTAEKKREFSEFCDARIKEGKMYPANKDAAVSQLMLAHSTVTSADFSEDEGKDNPLEALKNQFSNSPKLFEFGELEDPEEDTTKEDAQALADRARAFHEKATEAGRTISFTEAMDAVCNGKDKDGE